MLLQAHRRKATRPATLNMSFYWNDHSSKKTYSTAGATHGSKHSQRGCHDHTTRQGRSAGRRRDGGRTWIAGRVISEKAGGYSDVAVLPDRTILALYENPRTGDQPRGLLLARFDLAWLLGAN